MNQPEPANGLTIPKDHSNGSLARSIGYFGAFFVLGAVIASLGPTIPYLADQVGASLSDTGALLSIRSFGYLVGSLLIGRLYDRLPSHIVLILALLLLAVMMVFAPLSPYLLVSSILFFLIGIGTGGTDVGSNTLMTWTHGSKSGPYLNTMYFFAGVGGFLTPLLIARLSLHGSDLKLAYWLIVLVILPVVIWLSLQNSPVPNRYKISVPEAENSDLLLVLFFGVIFFLLVGIEVSYGGWIFTYTITSGIGQETQASFITSMYWLAITIGRLIAIPIAARARPASIVWFDLLGAFVCLGIISLGADSIWMVSLGTLGLGLSIASMFPTTFSLAERFLNISGKLTGWLWAFGSAGGIFVPWLIGQTIERVKPAAMMIVLWSGVGLAIAVFAGLMFYSKRVED